MRTCLIATVAVAVSLGAAGCGGGSSTASNAGGTTSRSGQAAGTGSGIALRTSAPAASGALSSISWDLPYGEPTTVDPIKAGDYSPDLIASNLCDDLFRLTPTWGQTPELATSYRYADDHHTLLLNIRHGVTFWDGHPLTAADVVYSLQRQADPKDGSVNSGFFAQVQSISQSGPSQVKIRFRTPDELLIKEFATVVGAVEEKSYVEKVGNKAFGSSGGGMMCSGPYELKPGAWKPGQDMVLTKNPSYWDRSLEPKIAKVTVKFISNTSTLTSALQSGEIDGTYEVPAVSVPALQKVGSGSLYFGPSLQIEELIANGSTGLGGNEKVREALSLTLDRSGIAQKIFSAAASPNFALTPPNSWAPASARHIYSAAYAKLDSGSGSDIAAAKKLIDTIPDHSQTLTIGIAAGDQTSIETATLIQQYAAQIGLKVAIKQLQPLDFSNAFYIKSYRQGLDFVLTSGFLDIPDQLDYLNYWIYPNSDFNWIGYRDSTTVNLTNRARETFNPVKRAQLLTQAQARYMHDNAIVVPLEALDEVSFLSHKIAGATTSFAYIFEPSFAYMGAAK